MKIIKSLIDKWDWWIYCRAHHSMRRICETRPGFAYLMELYLRDYRANHPISKQLEEATEVFHEEMKKYPSPTYYLRF